MGDVKKILVVSSSPRDRRCAALSAPAGADVVETCDCGQARQALAENPDVDVIICDLTLSDGSWWCMYQESVRRRRPPELIVLMPRRGLNAAEVEAYGVTVIAAPLDGDELAETVRRAADKSGALPAQAR